MEIRFFFLFQFHRTFSNDVEAWKKIRESLHVLRVFNSVWNNRRDPTCFPVTFVQVISRRDLISEL